MNLLHWCCIFHWCYRDKVCEHRIFIKFSLKSIYAFLSVLLLLTYVEIFSCFVIHVQRSRMINEKANKLSDCMYSDLNVLSPKMKLTNGLWLCREGCVKATDLCWSLSSHAAGLSSQAGTI